MNIEDKILKLLAKAESTTPEEAELLTAKAEELIIRYGIEQAELSERKRRHEGVAEQIVQRKVKVGTGTYSLPLQYLAWHVSNGLGNVKMLKGSGYAYFIGHESDVESAITLFQSLHLQAITAMRAWWKGQRDYFYWEPESRKASERKEFIYGFGRGVQARIAQTRTRAESEVKGTGTEVALVDRKQRVDRWVEENITLGRKSGRRSTGSYGSRASGEAAGRSANVGGTSVAAGAGRALTI